MCVSSTFICDALAQNKPDKPPVKNQVVVVCPACKKHFNGLKHPASRWQSAAIGAGVGGAAGAGGGFYAGMGVGIASGGTAFAAAPVFAAVGGGFGAIIGCGAGFIVKEGAFECPFCHKAFKSKVN